MKKNIREMLTGILLGDGHIRRSGTNKAYITFEQSKKKQGYFNYVHEMMRNEGLVDSAPKEYLRNDPRYNSQTESLQFSTKASEEYVPLANLFLDSEGKKKIPSNIGEYLTHKGLAH